METLTIILLLGFAILIAGMMITIGKMQKRINEIAKGNLNNWKEWLSMKNGVSVEYNSLRKKHEDSDKYFVERYEYVRYRIETLLEYLNLRIVLKVTPAKSEYVVEKIAEEKVGPKQGDPEKNNGWISVDERVPEKDVPVLVYFSSCDFMVARYSSGKKLWREWNTGKEMYAPTHWKLLPDGPAQ